MARELQRAPTLADQVRAQIDHLEHLLPTIENDHRSHRDTERVLDGIHGAGRVLCVLARGR